MIIEVHDEESELKLWVEYKKTSNPKIREFFITKYHPLVRYVAGSLAVNMPKNVDYEDLVSYGVFGLMDAIEKYDPEKKIKFKTYALTRIRGSIIDELRSYDHVPRNVRQRAKELSDVVGQLESRFGRKATGKEVAEALNVSLDDYYELVFKISGSTILSLDDMWFAGDENDKVSIVESVESPSSLQPDSIVENQEVKRIIIEAIQELPDKEKKVLVLYYYESLTLNEIGEILGVTESRVSQLHTRAIDLLRQKMTHIRKGIR